MPNVSWKNIFAGFQLTVCENKRTIVKKAALHPTTLVHFKARQVIHNLFNTNQVNGLEMTFMEGATKINLKNLKT